LLVSTDELRADDEKVNAVPWPTDPVLVSERVGLAVIPRSHVELKNGLATARTSSGVKARSKAEGMAVPLPARTLSIV